MVDVAPLISVVITCYNYAKYVAGAIDCVLAQSYPSKEVIVVNDGSTDESLSIITRYAARVRIIDQVNLGSSAAYNHGFAAATGEIVIFLDADDLLCPGALERVARAWSPACAKVQYDAIVIDADGKDLGRKLCNFDASYDAARVRGSFRRTGTYRWPVTVGNAYSYWFAKQLFPLAKGHYPDGTLNTAAPVYGDVITIPAALGCYRIHGQNLWSSGGSDLARLPWRIEHRRAEIAIMRRHAERHGVRLPAGTALDHEIAFINYRLMARTLGLQYPGAAEDSTLRLLKRACATLAAERYPLKLSLAHCLWFAGLSVSPPPAARALIRLRFTRQNIGAPFRSALRKLLGRSERERSAAPAAAHWSGRLGRPSRSGVE